MTTVTRREFIAAGTALLPLAALPAAGQDPAAKPAAPARRIKLGLIGCGGRGAWLAGLFRQHGGYEIRAVADYFPERAEKTGAEFGVDPARRFSGLGGYRRLLEGGGVEAVAVVNIPRFHPDHGQAAVEAGCHVYAAKPVAIDAPGALKVRAAGEAATRKGLCYLVDYQMGTDPIIQEVVRRIQAGGVGRLAHIDSVGFSVPWSERPAGSPEDRLRHWLTTVGLSGDVINELSVHTVNAVLWTVGRRPVSASGRARLLRPNPRDDYREIYLATYAFDDGLLWTHRCQSLANELDWQLKFDAFGDRATALVSYRGKSYLRGGEQHYGGGTVESLYDRGAIRNIAAFHDNILQGRFGNESARQASDDVLTCALGREACLRGATVTMDELLRENRALPFDPAGLKD